MNEHFKIDGQPAFIHELNANAVYDNDPAFSAVARRELFYVLSEESTGKAPDYDFIEGLVVRELCRNFMVLMCRLYSRCLARGYFPNCWKMEIVFFFRERNKLSHSL